MPRDQFYERDNLLIFDPTNVNLVNVVPHCSQIHLVLGLFRSAWKKIEAVFEQALILGDELAEDFNCLAIVDKKLEEILGEKSFLQSIFNLEIKVASGY